MPCHQNTHTTHLCHQCLPYQPPCHASMPRLCHFSPHRTRPHGDSPGAMQDPSQQATTVATYAHLVSCSEWNWGGGNVATDNPYRSVQDATVSRVVHAHPVRTSSARDYAIVARPCHRSRSPCSPQGLPGRPPDQPPTTAPCRSRLRPSSTRGPSAPRCRSRTMCWLGCNWKNCGWFGRGAHLPIPRRTYR